MKKTNVNKNNNYWHSLRHLSITLFFSLFLYNLSFSQTFLTASGTKIVNTSGTEVLLKGVNLGGWVLQEGWMIANDGNNPGTQAEMKKILYDQGQTEAQIEAYYQSYRNNFITKPDIDFIASKGMNCVRFPMHYELFLTAAQRSVRNSVIWNKANYANYKTQLASWVAANTIATDYSVEGYRLIDNLLSWCAANNIYVILDMHAVPGSQGTDEHIADCLSLENDLWYSTVNQDVLNAIWKNISLRYKNNANVAMYDVINEPNNANATSMHTMYQRLITTIRGNSDNHLIMIEGNGWGNNYSANRPTDFSPNTNLVFNIHRYGTTTSTTTTMSDPLQIQELGNAQNFRNTYQVPIFCGETGLSDITWITNNITAMNSVKIGWCMWSYKWWTDWNNWGFGRVPGDYPGNGVSAMASVLENIKFANMVQNPSAAYWAALNSTPPAPVSVTGVTVSPATASAASNGNVQLTATVAPSNATDKTVSWTSSNTAIAIVNSNGLVSGVANGTVTITAKTTDGGKTASSTITLTTPTQSPYSGVIAIPGTIEAENFDLGGEGLAYHDNEVVNQGNQYRPTEGVDIETCDWGGYDVGYAVAGEWMEYTVNVASTGTYDVKVQAASGDAAGGSLRIEFDNVDKTGTITIPYTSGWQAYQDITKTGVSLTSGQHIMKIYTVAASYNLNNVTFTTGTSSIAVTGVTLAPTTLSLIAGGTSTLTATVVPSNATNKAVSYTSSNTAVATVNASGVVTAVAAGSATITVTTTDQSKTATCAVTVTASNVAVTGVTLAPTTLSLSAGGTSTLTATVTPSNATNKAVTYTSSNTAAATVNSSGVVTGVTAGTATITVTTTDQSKTATCAVTVTASNIAVTGVTLAPTTLSLSAGGTSSLTATVAPSNATNKAVTYSSNNTAVATVSSSGVVTGVAAGTATITVTTTDGNKTATCVVTVTSSGCSFNQKFEAENYTEKSGTPQSEACSDTDGGLDMGWIGNNDWFTFDITIPCTATYTVQLRVASLSGGATIRIEKDAGATLLGTVNVPNTGAWQTWTTISTTVTLPAGSYKLGLNAGTGGFNLNWLTVSNAAAINVTGVTLSPATLSLAIGGSSTLVATVAPSNASNQAVTYTSSNTAIATVSSSGVVTGVAAGTASITVKTTDQNKTATCAVTVNPTAPSTFPGYYNIFSVNSTKPLDVKDVSTTSGASIQQWDLSTTGGGANQRWRLDDAGNGNYYIKVKSTQMCLALQTTSTADGIKVIQQTCNNSNTQQWTVTDIGSSNYKIINVYSGKSLDVTDVSTANGALIQVWTYNGGPNQKWYFTQIETTKSARVATEIDNSNVSDEISIFPNPAADFIKVSHSLDVNCIEIYSLSGKLILKNKVEENSETTLNIADLKSGIYVIKTFGKNGVSFNKFIKK